MRVCCSNKPEVWLSTCSPAIACTTHVLRIFSQNDSTWSVPLVHLQHESSCLCREAQKGNIPCNIGLKSHNMLLLLGLVGLQLLQGCLLLSLFW